MVKMQGGVFGAVARSADADPGDRMSEEVYGDRRPAARAAGRRHRRRGGRHRQAFRRPHRARRRLGDASSRQRARAAGRERRRQIDPGQMHHGLLPPRRGQRHRRQARGRDREPAPGPRPRPRHGLPAFHARAAHDRAREHGDGARRRAGGHRLARRAHSASTQFLETMPFTRAARRAGRHACRRREAEGRNAEAALSRKPLPHPRRADLGPHASTRPTRSSA